KMLLHRINDKEREHRNPQQLNSTYRNRNPTKRRAARVYLLSLTPGLKMRQESETATAKAGHSAFYLYRMRC
ncbi:MAG TPA: hypothetical protein PKZ52_10625, partial [Cellvibrionaceae bacterium]|nr:hypothetical protein [Cellvibrionaceae bacterium]